uniref:Uncharacterized protein n=1 Tax=Parascaris equorum TaxID=6256 RepID=A0A914RWZ4_PAREQ
MLYVYEWNGRINPTTQLATILKNKEKRKATKTHHKVHDWQSLHSEQQRTLLKNPLQTWSNLRHEEKLYMLTTTYQYAAPTFQ